MTDAADRSVIRPPEQVVGIARTLQHAGYQAWCVGGAIRDAYLGHAHLDWDLATSAEPAVVRKLFRRTVPVGIEFGTIGVLDADGRMHEVTTFRRDVKTDGRHAVVEFGASLDDDLARRDFTINAIAFDPIAGTLHDPFGGRTDLAAKVVRAVGDANARLTEDRLRALRAIRFAARFDFAIDDATWLAIVASAPHLTRLSPERVKQELEKTMEQVPRPSHAFVRWRESGAFASLIPPLAQVSDQTLAAIDCLPPPVLDTRPLRRSLRMAALFSALDGKSTEGVLRALRFSNQDTSVIASLVDRWHRFGGALTRLAGDAGDGVDAGALRRLAADVGRLRVSAFVRLAAACWEAGRDGQPTARQVRDLYRQLTRVAFDAPLELADLAVDGDDLRGEKVVSGPSLGAMLRRLMDDVIADPALNQRDILLERARRYAMEGTRQ